MGRGARYLPLMSGRCRPSTSGRARSATRAWDDGRVASSRVDYALLYRTPTRWRINVGTPERLACSALHADPTEPFSVAAREFETLLKRDWDVDGPLAWEQLRPDWWGVDVVPGALESAGERSF